MRPPVGRLAIGPDALFVAAEKLSQGDGARVVRWRITAKIVFVRADAGSAGGAACAAVGIIVDVKAVGTEPDAAGFTRCHRFNCQANR